MNGANSQGVSIHAGWRPSPDDVDIYHALVARRLQVDRPLRVPWRSPLKRWPWLKMLVDDAARRGREGAARLRR
jgi:hypothetical protein